MGRGDAPTFDASREEKVMVADVETMFSARELPWHQLGVVTESELPMYEAIRTAGLEWRVTEQPVFAQLDSGEFVPAEDKKALVRDSDHKVLGVHGLGYVPFQNEQLFEFVEAIIDADEQVLYETAGALKGGRVVFATVKLPTEVVIADDEHVPYLVMANSFDGSLAIAGVMTTVRVVCQNTLTLAIRNALSQFRVRHTATAQHRVAQAKEALGLSYRYLDEFAQSVERMMNETMLMDDFEAMLTKVFPEPRDASPQQLGNTDRRRNTVRELYFESPTVRPFTGVAWGGITAVNEWEVWSTGAATSKMGRKAMAERQMRRVLSSEWPKTEAARKALSMI